MLIMIMNCLTSTGSPNFTRHLTNNDSLLAPKMFYKTSVDTPYKNTNCCEGEASYVLCHCICQKWGNQMWILKNSKELLENLKSNPFFFKSTASNLITLQHFIRLYLIMN
jgi:hypothetical protein